MIIEIIFAILMGGILGYIIFRFKSISEKKKLYQNIPEKIKKQDKVFFEQGKEVKIGDKNSNEK